MVEVERLPSANGAVAKRNPRRVRWVDDEACVASRKACVASRKARVLEVIFFLSPPQVPARHSISQVASVTGEGGSDRHARDPGFITVVRGRRRKGRGGRH